MNTFNDDYITDITVIKCTQVGATEALLNIVGYVMDRMKRRMLYVLPTDAILKQFSEFRMQRFLSACQCLNGNYHDNSADKMLEFAGGFLKFASSENKADLSSWSIPYVFFDEEDKFPMKLIGESTPAKLGIERTKNWAGPKRYHVSSPSLKTGPIYKSWESADVQYQFWVPCPHCGEYQLLSWKNIKFDSNETDKTVIESQAEYHCPYCGFRIKDSEKPNILIQGEWRPNKIVKGHPRNVAFHINSLYSPFLTFGQIAREFMDDKDDPKKLQNFVNSWLGEPWENEAAKLDSDMIKKRRDNLPMGIVPKWAVLLAGGVDVQKNCCYWNISAYGIGIKSHVVAYGTARTLEDVSDKMDQWWPAEDGGAPCRVSLYGVDSGYHTDDIYEFCLQHANVAVPVKGSSNPMIPRYKRTYVVPSTRKNDLTAQQILYVLDTDQYKDRIFAHMQRDMDSRGAWMANKDIDDDYAEQLTSEHKILTVKGNREVASWVPKTAAKANHLLDATVYTDFIADLLGIDTMTEKPPPPKQKPPADDGPELPDMEL